MYIDILCKFTQITCSKCGEIYRHQISIGNLKRTVLLRKVKKMKWALLFCGLVFPDSLGIIECLLASNWVLPSTPASGARTHVLGFCKSRRMTVDVFLKAVENRGFLLQDVFNWLSYLVFFGRCCCCFLPLPGVIQCNFVPLRHQPKTGCPLLKDKGFPKKNYLILSG